MPASSLSILHVVRAPIGGIYRHIDDLARAQAEAGHRVGLICDSGTGGAFEAARIEALAPALAHGVTRIPMRRAVGPADVATAWRVHRICRTWKPDIIHGHGAKGGVYARLAGAIERTLGRRTATFYSPHGGSLHHDPQSLGGRIYFGVERALERLTDGLIHVSRHEAETYRAKIGAPRCPAGVVHNGLRPEEFEQVVAGEDAVDFLYIGMLRDLKGVDLFIEAMADLVRKGRRPRALIVGDGDPDDESRYRELVLNHGLSGFVRFHAAMPARKAFAMARAIVVPSRAESLPYIVLEAAAAGMPMFATSVGGIPEIFAIESERLVQPGSVKALSAAMAACLDDPARFSAEAAARRYRLQSGFSLSDMTGRIERLYRETLFARTGEGAGPMRAKPAL